MSVPLKAAKAFPSNSRRCCSGRAPVAHYASSPSVCSGPGWAPCTAKLHYLGTAAVLSKPQHTILVWILLDTLWPTVERPLKSCLAVTPGVPAQLSAVLWQWHKPLRRVMSATCNRGKSAGRACCTSKLHLGGCYIHSWCPQEIQPAMTSRKRFPLV